MSNGEAATAAQGAGIQAAQTVSRLKPDALVTGHCGPKAFTALRRAGIKIYQSDASTVRDALAALTAGELKPVLAPDKAGHGPEWTESLVVAVASGKGGTGKTTVSVNLARVIGSPVQILDCDVEEPNAQLFLGGRLTQSRPVVTLIPEVDDARCDGCGDCARLCQFNAIVSFGTAPLVFPELCHSCGGCARVCPTGAIREVERRIGVLETYEADDITLIQGIMDVGVAMAPPPDPGGEAAGREGVPAILDAPPGRPARLSPPSGEPIVWCWSPSPRLSGSMTWRWR